MTNDDVGTLDQTNYIYSLIPVKKKKTTPNKMSTNGPSEWTMSREYFLRSSTQKTALDRANRCFARSDIWKRTLSSKSNRFPQPNSNPICPQIHKSISDQLTCGLPFDFFVFVCRDFSGDAIKNIEKIQRYDSQKSLAVDLDV